MCLITVISMFASQTSDYTTSKWPKATITEKTPGMMPRWVTSALPKPKTPGYDIVRIGAHGRTLPEAKLNARKDLVNRLATIHHITLDQNSNDTEVTAGDEVLDNKKVFIQKIGDKTNGIFKCQVIDEYYERRGREYYVVELIAATNEQGEIPDKFEPTTSYGVAPVFYSLIPGVGQMYKGSTAKGGIILGSAVVVGAGIITAESLRASYIKKMKEYPKFHDFYNNKATTWKNIRNVTLGVGAGLYIYNLIDAAVAPGRPRVIVSKNKSYYYSFAPTWNGENLEMAFTLNF